MISDSMDKIHTKQQVKFTFIVVI